MKDCCVQSRKMFFVGLLWWAMGMLTACCGDIVIHSSIMLLFLISLFCVLGLASMLPMMNCATKCKTEKLVNKTDNNLN